MFIDISKIPQGTTVEQRVLLMPEELAEAGAVSPEVDAKISIRRLEESLYVTVDFTGTVTRNCDRCLKDFTEPVSATVDFVLQHAEESEEYGGELDCYQYRDEQDKIDFSQSVYDAMLLKLGYKAICSADCKGLSGPSEIVEVAPPVEETSVDPRWAALAKMKKNYK